MRAPAIAGEASLQMNLRSEFSAPHSSSPATWWRRRGASRRQSAPEPSRAPTLAVLQRGSEAGGVDGVGLVVRVRKRKRKLATGVSRTVIFVDRSVFLDLYWNCRVSVIAHTFFKSEDISIKSLVCKLPGRFDRRWVQPTSGFLWPKG